jgi:hypothetical protein
MREGNTVRVTPIRLLASSLIGTGAALVCLAIPGLMLSASAADTPLRLGFAPATAAVDAAPMTTVTASAPCPAGFGESATLSYYKTAEAIGSPKTLFQFTGPGLDKTALTAAVTGSLKSTVVTTSYLADNSVHRIELVCYDALFNPQVGFLGELAISGGVWTYTNKGAEPPTASPSASASASASASVSASASASASAPAEDPTDDPTGDPTDDPTDDPADDPTDDPAGDTGTGGQGGGGGGGGLPITGTDTAGIVATGLALVGAGIAAMYIARRRVGG